jgi:hypothetical protein
MKVSKKEIAKFQKKEQARSQGRVANNLEQDQALESLKQKLSKPETMAVLQRMKDR